MNILGKLVNYDIEELMLYIKVPLFDEHTLEAVDAGIRESRLQRITVRTSRFKEPITYPQLKKWWVNIKLILQHETEKSKKEGRPEYYVTTENMLTLHHDLKRTYLPCKWKRIGMKDLPIVPSIMDMSKEEMMKALTSMQEDYGDYGVDFYYDKKEKI